MISSLCERLRDGRRGDDTAWVTSPVVAGAPRCTCRVDQDYPESLAIAINESIEYVIHSCLTEGIAGHRGCPQATTTYAGATEVEKVTGKTVALAAIQLAAEQEQASFSPRSVSRLPRAHRSCPESGAWPRPVQTVQCFPVL